MKTVYLDADYAVHLESSAERTPFETDFFDGACDTMIEGYRIVPEGQTWAREDGKIFTGLMVTPLNWTDALDAAQTEYEKAQAALTEIETALGVSV